MIHALGKMDETSILKTIRHMLGGIVDDETYFDLDLKIFINAAFTKLWQLGVGPTDEPFKINDDSETWDDFEYDNIEMVKEWIYLDVKNMFDPPANGSVLQAYKDRMFEDEFRMNIMAEEIRDGKQTD